MAQRHHDKNDSAHVPFGLGTMAVMNGSVANALAQNRSMFERGIRAWQEEALRFINRQLEDNAEVIESCQQCDSLAELLSLQHRWMTHRVIDFYDEGARIGEAMHRILSERVEEAGAETVSELRRTKRRTEQQEAA